jgi:hypothetical protein
MSRVVFQEEDSDPVRLRFWALAALLLAVLWTRSATADLAGASVFGELVYPIGYPPPVYSATNLFDPANGMVPAGYSNSSSPTIVLSGAGVGSFAWLQGGGTIENPGIDSWLAEFDGTRLTVTFVNNYSQLSGSRLTFVSDAFVGRSLTRVGEDDFLRAGNGPMTATLVGNTLILDVAPQCTAGGGCPWPTSTYSNVYSLDASNVLSSLVLANSTVAGCKSVSGTVTLAQSAPAGGLKVELSDTLVAASAPVSVLVPEGAISKKFTIKTKAVAEVESGEIFASLFGVTLSRALTVRPIGLQSVSLTPTSVVGGLPVAGKATLECNAALGPIMVDLTSTDPGIGSPIAASIFIPQGLKSATFDVTTAPVQTKSYAMIAGTANDITKSKRLTVNVAVAVSPTSLKFGSVVLGTTSAPLNATLTNKGAVPFSVNSITLTGTAASWFAQTNDCPASLAAGASCTISVTFTPLAAASKSAKLSIATSATATPLSVSLSGTGVLPP